MVGAGELDFAAGELCPSALALMRPRNAKNTRMREYMDVLLVKVVVDGHTFLENGGIVVNV